MRFHKVAAVATLALAGLPAVALGAHPATPANTKASTSANATSTTGTSSKASTHAAAPKVLFVLRGKLTAYTAAAGAVNGSVSITVNKSNFEAGALKDATLVFPVSSDTKITGTFVPGHNGIVKVRAVKNASSSALQALTAFQVIDQGASS